MRDGQDAGVSTTPLATVADALAPIVYGIVQPGPETPGGVPFVQSRDVGGAVDVNALNRTSQQIAQQYRRSKIAPGDILFSLRGNIGQSSMAPAELDGANIARGVARIRVGAKGDQEFVRYVLQGPVLQRLIARNANGSTFRELSIEELRKLPIPDVSLPEQRKIAEILRTWDEALEKLTALRATKELQYRSLGRKFFEPCHPSFHGRPNTWQEFELGDIFTERNQTGENGERLLSVTMNGGVIDRDDVGRKDTSTEDKSRYKLVLPGDIAYNTMRMWQGVSGLSTMRGIVSPAYTVVTPREHHIVGRYAAHLFKSRRMVFDFERYSQGLTSDTWNLKFPAFSKIRLWLPPTDEQEKQANLLDALLSEQDVLRRQIAALTRQKRGLMQKLLTGEWRVATAEKGSTEAAE